MNRLATFLFTTVVLTSCERQQQPNPQSSLIFGVAYGFCVGDCAHFYKLFENKLLRDNIERYADDMITFDDIPLSKVRYEYAKTLLENFPVYLLNHPNQTFGCPDCADQGGIHLYYTTGSETRFWHIDTNTDNQPEEIREYMAQVRNTIEQLQN